MGDYDILIQKNQSGEINDLEFLLAQEELAPLYISDMQEQGITPDNENALAWLQEYENNNLYQ